MAPNRPQAYADSFPHRNRANALPAAFKCASDGKWLQPDNFSQKQLAKWFQRKTSPNDGVTPANIGLVCKQHSGQPLNQEIKCHGPCGAWKYREHFSKNQRNDPEPWCTICTSWTYQFGGTEVPLPPPSSKMTPDEVIAQTTMIQSQLPDMPIEASARDSGAAVSTMLKYGSRIKDGGKKGSMLEAANSLMTGTPTNSLMTGTSSLVDGTTNTRSTEQGDSDNKGVIAGLSSLSLMGQDAMGGQTTLVQQSAARTTHSSHSDSQGGAGSVATPTQSTLGPQGKKTVNTRDQSLPGDNSSVTTTEDQTTREGIRADVKPKVFVQASTKWVKGDKRKVFYVPPAYAAHPEDQAAIDNADESEDEF
ncbi:Stc1 domain-containing protein [Hypoxylon rubiginosum]|uniref:Stc1 domain-containing protein n=1 Tax=Hypoxylon rubiginosum TaxID=110542 RepID=A0ACC0DK24_9PEZI|nr:Stc1 domain-containing protein [Hypoxylon rubiginosum]